MLDQIRRGLPSTIKYVHRIFVSGTKLRQHMQMMGDRQSVKAHPTGSSFEDNRSAKMDVDGILE
jgi:hypothetical protein